MRDGGDGVRGGGDGVIVRRMRADDVAALDAIMRAAYGVERHAAFIRDDAQGYVVVQRSNATTIVGPWIAFDAGIAGELLNAALAIAGDRETTLFVPWNNDAACDLALAAGFVPRRMLRHMIRGTGATPSLAVFGRANLGQG